jgi:hypothetical protein
MNEKKLYKISVYVPRSHSEKVKLAMFNQGAGKIGDYECCCFETNGIGQFRPLSGSRPSVGEINQIEKVEEVKLEMICANKFIHEVVDAMKEKHPYEEVAYDVILLENF